VTPDLERSRRDNLSFPRVFRTRYPKQYFPCLAVSLEKYQDILVCFLERILLDHLAAPAILMKGMVGDGLLILSSTGADGGRSTDRV